MGNNNSTPPRCLICWEDIVRDPLWITCVRCKIHLHASCESLYRSNKGFCKCPHCQAVGLLMTTSST